MFRTAFASSLLLRGVMAATAFAVVTPTAMMAVDASAKRGSSASKSKMKAKAAKAKKEKEKREAEERAMKAKKEKMAKHMGAIERLDQIATATNNKELADIVTRLKDKAGKVDAK